MNNDDDYSKLLMEAYRLSEKRLEVQQAFAVAADQKALMLAVAAIAAATFASNVQVESGSFNYGQASSVFFAICSLLSLFSAIPQTLHSAGILFSEIKPTLEARPEFQSAITNLAENYEECFRQNEQKRKKMATIYSFGLSMFGFGVIIFLVFQIINTLT